MPTTDRQATVGFVGLGAMGGPMAGHIVRKGFALVVHDIDPAKVAELVALGATAAQDAADVARQAAILISMVDTTEQAEEVIAGPAGFAVAAQAGDVIVSMSTIDPMAMRKLQPRLAATGIALLDAPVTGFDQGARDGTLRAFVGGPAEALERIRPVLQTMTSEILHLGALGNGLAMKLVNNMLFQVHRILVVEALALGTRAGLDPQQIFEVISKTASNSPAFQNCAARVLARDFEGIRMDITYKDIELQSRLAKSVQMPLFMANTAQQVYQMARAQGLGGEDGAAVVKIYEQFTGVVVQPRRPSGADPGRTP